MEFSYDYDLEKRPEKGRKLERYAVPVVEGARRFFEAMQDRTDWVSFDATTKTGFAYGDPN